MQIPIRTTPPISRKRWRAVIWVLITRSGVALPRATARPIISLAGAQPAARRATNALSIDADIATVQAWDDRTGDHRRLRPNCKSIPGSPLCAFCRLRDDCPADLLLGPSLLGSFIGPACVPRPCHLGIQNGIETSNIMFYHADGDRLWDDDTCFVEGFP